MVQGKWFPSNENLETPLALRRAVFGQAGDSSDEWAQQVVVYEDPETPVGTARLRWNDGSFVMDYVGVLPEKRRRGFGDLLVRLCLFKSLTHHGRQIRLVCPEDLTPFFARYGFQNDQTMPNGCISMSVLAEDIHLDHCNGHCDGCR